MSGIRLRGQVTKRVRRTVVTKDALYASICDCCGKVFQMGELCNEEGRAELRGTFDCCATDPDTGKGLGNGFTATVCSFTCAQKLWDGKWRKLKEYKPYVDVDATLARGKVVLTSDFKEKDELIKEWEEQEESKEGYDRVFSYYGPIGISMPSQVPNTVVDMVVCERCQTSMLLAREKGVEFKPCYCPFCTYGAMYIKLEKGE